MGGTAAQRKSADSRQRQADGAGRPVGLSRSVTATQQNRVLLLQIEIFLSTHPQQSKSVTSRPTFDPYPLQIKTTEAFRRKISICNTYRPKTTPDVTDRDEQTRSDQTSQSVTSRPTFGLHLLQIKTTEAFRRKISICNTYRPKTTPDVTDRDEQTRSDQTSQSVTSRPTFGLHLLQIETNGNCPSEYLNL